MKNSDSFTFAISLSVLNHLGRNLYRSFVTVLGEAISNSWDADAKNVWIHINRKKNSLLIADDGIGMTADDFQSKFLKIGYSKRKRGSSSSKSGRPFIGRKGIGKLALLSCADKITVISKIKGGTYVGGVIDNSKLDEAITDDLTPQQYRLGQWDATKLRKHTRKHKQGTIIYFESIKEGTKRSFKLLRKLIALYFRFSLLDKSFNMFLDDEKITHRDLKDLAEKTQFMWEIGKHDDPYVRDLIKVFSKRQKAHKSRKLHIAGVKGFLASVDRPRALKIMTTDDRAGVDLFVNGRLRERDILKHTPTARLVENYLYGQIHFNALDDKVDRFTSSREGVVADDPKFEAFLETFRKAILEVVEDWDKWRIKNREEGDPENERLTIKQRASLGLYGAVSKDYELAEDSRNHDKVDGWVDALQGDAAFNLESYADCFVSENLIRKFVQAKKIPLSMEAKNVAADWKRKEIDSKNKGNISIEIRRVKNDLSYLAMNDLAYLVDKRDPITEAGLSRDANEYKPIRDAAAHTALLTEAAKKRLGMVRENIKGRIKTLLSKSK